jgi:cell division protein FtsW (lipid II flippase)
MVNIRIAYNIIAYIIYNRKMAEYAAYRFQIFLSPVNSPMTKNFRQINFFIAIGDIGDRQREPWIMKIYFRN